MTWAPTSVDKTRTGPSGLLFLKKSNMSVNNITQRKASSTVFPRYCWNIYSNSQFARNNLLGSYALLTLL